MGSCFGSSCDFCPKNRLSTSALTPFPLGQNKRQKRKGSFCLLPSSPYNVINFRRSHEITLAEGPRDLLATRAARSIYHAYWRLRYECSDPSLMGSLMMVVPLRIFMLYKQDGFVHTQALYSMEAPWLPKSESGTRSPSPHLRHRGKINSTPFASFLLRNLHSHAPPDNHLWLSDVGEGSEKEASAAASAPLRQPKTIHIIPYLPRLCQCNCL